MKKAKWHLIQTLDGLCEENQWNSHLKSITNGPSLKEFGTNPINGVPMSLRSTVAVPGLQK